MNELENHLQVSIMHKALIFNLMPEKPRLLDEIDQMDHLYNP